LNNAHPVEQKLNDAHPEEQDLDPGLIGQRAITPKSKPWNPSP
jgi:hypothetical protein